MKHFFLALAVALTAGEGGAQQALPPVAVLQGLDKVTSHVLNLTVAVGEAVNFGSLTLHVDACVKRPPEEPPESAVFLRIVDHPPFSSPPLDPVAAPFDLTADRLVFSGWMFASSPALNPLEHPIFDIILLDCRPPKEGSHVSSK